MNHTRKMHTNSLIQGRHHQMLRLGSRRTYFPSADSITAKLYQKVDYVDERHRHRYEVNPDMVEKLEQEGLLFVGKDETYRRMQILELTGHPYFVGVQFHPEFKSRPGKASAVFLGLYSSMVEYKPIKNI